MVNEWQGRKNPVFFRAAFLAKNGGYEGKGRGITRFADDTDEKRGNPLPEWGAKPPLEMAFIGQAVIILYRQNQVIQYKDVQHLAGLGQLGRQVQVCLAGL